MFNWGANEGEEVVSKYIWVFVALSVSLTCLTLLAWRFGTQHSRREKSPGKYVFDNSMV